MVCGWLFKGSLGAKLGKNYLILERLVGETFMNQWKNIYPWWAVCIYLLICS